MELEQQVQEEDTQMVGLLILYQMGMQQVGEQMELSLDLEE